MFVIQTQFPTELEASDTDVSSRQYPIILHLDMELDIAEDLLSFLFLVIIKTRFVTI